MTARVSAVNQLKTVMNVSVFREGVVQKEQLTHEERLVSLVEGSGTSEKRRQPRPAPQVGPHLSEKFESPGTGTSRRRTGRNDMSSESVEQSTDGERASYSTNE